MSDVVRFLVLGFGVAASYVLLAQGIVVIYRGSGVVNFSQSGIAIAGGYIYWECSRFVPTVLAVFIGIAGGAVLGALIQVTVMWPMRRFSALARIAASLAVLEVIQAALTLIFGSTLQIIPGFLPTTTFRIAGTIAIGVDELYLFAGCIVLTIILAQFYKRTRFGLATSGVAESPAVLASMGWSPARVAVLNWAVGGALAALAGIILVPIVGLGPTILEDAVIPALAAALIGSFSSFYLTLVGGIVIGVLESETTRWISAPGWSSAVPFLAILLILTIRGRALPSRGFISERLPRLGSGRISSPLFVASLAAVLAVTLSLSSSWAGALTVTTAYGLFALSLVVVSGYCGQISLAQLAIGGLAALFAGRLAEAAGLPFPLALLCGVALTVPAGLVVALPALRARGVDLAIATLGLAVVIQSIVLANPSWTGGAVQGTVIPSPRLFGWNVNYVSHAGRYAAVGVVLFAIAAFMVAKVRGSSIGRAMVAVRENERAAASVGVNVVATKLYAFGVGSALAALAGIILAFGESTVNYTQFSFDGSIQVLLLAVIGGVGYIGGAIIAGTLVSGGLGQQLISEFVQLTNQWALVLSAFLVIQLTFNPDGLVIQFVWLRATLREWRDQLRRSSAKVPASVPFIPRVMRVQPKVLELRDVVVRYGGVTAVDRLSFTVEPGQVVGLIGPNGAGKTTVIDATSGFVRPSSGEVRFGGAPIDGWTPHRRARAGLIRSWQTLELFDVMTVEENIRTAADRRRLLVRPLDLIRRRQRPLGDAAWASIHEFGLGEVLEKLPTELNNAQRRLVGIARTVTTAPSVLLLDEPTAGLDPESTQEVTKLIGRLARQWGMGVLLVEHDVSVVMAACDKIVAVDFGREVVTGTPAEVRSHPQVIDAYLGASELDENIKDTGSAGVILENIGSSVHSAKKGVAQEYSRAIALSASGLNVGYGPIRVIRDLDLEVRDGEVIGIFGANGSGKTTLLKALAGVLSPASGVVSIGGLATDAPLHRRARNGLAYMMDERSIFRSLTVAENLRLGACDPDRAFKIMPELELLAGRKVGLMSGGEQQMLSLALAMAKDSRILVCDELSLGLAPVIVRRLLQRLRIAASEGVAVILVEQHLQAALSVVDRGYVLRRGSVVMSGTADDLLARVGEIEGHYLSEFEGEGVVTVDWGDR